MRPTPSIYISIAIFIFSGSTFADKWYEGGTLHKASITEWRNATYSNKLATSADWALQSPSVKSTVLNSGDIDTIKIFATQLANCVDTATDGNEYSGTAGDIAAACIIQLGWME